MKGLYDSFERPGQHKPQFVISFIPHESLQQSAWRSLQKEAWVEKLRRYSVALIDACVLESFVPEGAIINLARKVKTFLGRTT